MSNAVERMLMEARSLPPDEREDRLAVVGFGLHDEDDDEAIAADWAAELARRSREVECGSATLLSHDEFVAGFSEAREELGRQRARE